MSVTASGAITGFSFAPGTPADLSAPTSLPVHLLALEKSAQTVATSDDAALRAAIVNVANHYLRLAQTKSPAEMEALIWGQDSLDGADHGPSCAAFASLTLELAAQAVGQQSWVTGGSTYPWPLHDWADVRVDPNPSSPDITSVLQDAQAHDRWHPLGDGYVPRPGDWVLFDGHVEVVTSYSDGVLHTIGGDSLPNYSVNAHTYSGSLADSGIAGFVDNGNLTAAGGSAARSSTGGTASQATGSVSGTATGVTGSVSPTASGATATAGATTSVATTSPSGTTSKASTSPSGATSVATGSEGGTAAVATGSGTGAASATSASTATPSSQSGAASVPGAAAAGSGGATTEAAAASTRPATTEAKPATSSAKMASSPRARTASSSVSGPSASAQHAFINEVAPGAIATQREYGVPAAVTIAQAIEESGWGQSKLAVEAHNLFGIKGTGPAGSVSMPTSEYENGEWVTTTASFRAYHDVAESIADHGRLLATDSAYSHAMADRSIPDAFAADLAGVYATDPGYGGQLVALMRLYDLYRFDATSSAAGGSSAQSSHASAKGDSATTAPTGSVSVPAASVPAASVPAADVPTASGSAAASTASGRAGAASTQGTSAAGGGTVIPGTSGSTTASTINTSARVVTAPRHVKVAPRSERATGITLDARIAGTRTSAPSRRSAPSSRTVATRERYRERVPLAVATAFLTSAKAPIARAEPLYRDVAEIAGIPWELLAACDWLQCEARLGYSPVQGEKLGKRNSDGTVYHTKSEALGQCAADLMGLAAAVYGIDLTTRRRLSVHELANAFAAFRWGGLLRKNRISAMEFPYSVAGLTAEHTKMCWPRISDPNAPDKPGTRFRGAFGAVPIVLTLDYPATV